MNVTTILTTDVGTVATMKLGLIIVVAIRDLHWIAMAGFVEVGIYVSEHFIQILHNQLGIHAGFYFVTTSSRVGVCQQRRRKMISL